MTMQRTKISKAISALIMTLVLIFQMLSPVVAFAATADRDTTTKYTESLGDEASTEYAGRIWTDKSVFTSNVTFDTYGGGTETVTLNAENAEDFLISYSALATSMAVSGQSQAPVDVVLVLDISGSMSNGDSNMDNRKSRIYNTVVAAEAAIDSLMAMNPYNRVAVAVFSSNSQVLLPLDRYQRVTTTERQWVSTGNWSGYWDEVIVDVPYFSLNREEASSNYARLTTRAIRQSNSQAINVTVDVEGGTNIQMGLYEGMQILVNEAETKATINGTRIQRVPSVVLLSDGSPTYSSDSAAWWAPSDNNNDGPGSAPYAGNGMKAILVGAYMKAAIDRNYGVANTAYATTVYTVGMGITGLEEDEQNLAYMTLDPGTHWDRGGSNTMKTEIKDYWSDYTARNNTGTLRINVGKYENNRYTNDYYNLTHPNTGYDVDPTNGYNYVDDYYDADNASAVTDVFRQIVSNIAISAPQVPTEIKGNDPLTDGYITYTDPIGHYMQVKDVKAIIYAGTKFTQKTVSVSGDTTSYTFQGEVHSPVYGDQSIQNILITVTKDAQGNETLTVKIPASVIPLRVNTVQLNEDGSVKSHTNNGAFPTRVVYSVGMRSDVKQVAEDGDVYVDATKIDPDYLLKNTNEDGSINFYSNVFSGNNNVNGYTAGDAAVEFEPAHNNPFYFIQEDMPIYLDAEFRNQATGTLDPAAIYYYNDVYYHGTTVESRPIARTGEQLLRTEVITGADGFLYRAEGSPRLNRILRFEGTKVENATGTAEDFYAPIFVHADGSTDPYEGKFVVYLGNNGVVSFLAGGNLEISKDVATAAGVTAPDKTFTFHLDLNGEEVSNGEYTYIIRDAEQNQVSRGTVSKLNPTITLSDGQTATVYSLPPLTTYTITETPVDGFTSEATGASGTIHAGHTHSAVFTNTYSVTPVTSENLTGIKVLQGRDWAEGDSFTFALAPYNDCPLPAGYDITKGITVTKDDAVGSTATFAFGQIEFTAPGIYRYTVAEVEPENDHYLPGMTYSRALYRIVYVVVDDGAGKLSIDAARSGIQKLYDDDANRLFSYDSNNQIVMNPGQEAQDDIRFTNTYTAGSVLRVPTAMKVYSDPSGTNPLVSGMFRFRIRALGYMVDDGALQTDISKIPMPAGSVNGEAITTNEGHNVTFPAIEFTQSLLTDNGADKMTYRYEMSEVIPAAADRIPGMSYDDSTFVVDVVVQIDPTSSELVVSANVPDGQRQPIFENSYTLTPATGTINGTKTLLGRDMLPGETFEFTLVGADAATNMAVRDGIITVPDSEASVSGAGNGQAAAFRFEGITFNRPGTYTFLVTETPGTAPAVSYDNSKIAVTFVVADSNGDAVLDITSVTYSNGKTSADFVNTYTYRFNDTPVSLEGTKYLTGKSLVEGEFYFNVQAYHGSGLLTEYLVSHDVDNTATNGVYEGNIVFLSDATYNEPGTYTYYITEQIPSPENQVGGTQYDGSAYRFTVVVADDGAGSLKVTSKTLERRESGGWTAAADVRFNNAYVPNATTAQLPLIKKVISGNRVTALQAGEFRFRLSVTSAEPADGIILPAQTEVGNAQNGDILFAPITFTKAGLYRVSVTEVIPEDSQKVPGITYSTQRIDAVYRVIDDRNGNLTAVLTQFEGDTIINEYVKEPDSVVISGTKVLVGGGLKAGDYSFCLYAADENYAIDGQVPLHTVSNAADGSFAFTKDDVPQLNFTEAGTYYFVVMEDLSNQAQGIRYDTTVYNLQVEVTDNGRGSLEATLTQVNGSAITFTNVPHDEIVKKEAALVSDPTVNIDGKKVNPGQTLRYSISYHNYTGAPADVTVTDTIPAGTTFLSADNGGTFASGVITWNLTGVAAGADVTVTFDVKVNETATSLENQATVLEGTNEYKTNVVTNPVTEDKVEKDVFLVSAPTVSIDGQKVAVGETLVYTITYTNADDAQTQVTITDAIPANTTYVDGSADNGGTFASGKVTWNLTLAAGQSKTVSFRVKADTPDVFIDNKAIAQEGSNTIETNTVTNHTYEEVGGKDVALESAPGISIDGKQVVVGEVLVYTITYTNVTDAPVDVVITDTIPAHTELYNAGTGKVDGSTLTWEFAAVQPRQTVTASFLVKVTEPGETIENQAQIFDGTNKLTNKVTNAVPGKTVDKQVVSVGDKLTYVLSYRNVTGKAAKVVITDHLASALQFVEGSAGDGVYDNGTVTWTYDNVPAGGIVTVSFQAIVKADTEGSITNQAKVYENDVAVSFTNETVTETRKPQLTIEKAQKLDGAATTGKLTVKEGDQVTYLLTVSNTGRGDAYGITVTDKLPEGLIFQSADNGGVLLGSTVTWNLATLGAGESVTLSFRVKVPAVQKDTQWKNIAAFVYENNPEGEDKITESNEVQLERKVPMTPETGDSFNLVFFVSLMILSSFGLAAMLVFKKREETEETAQ